MNSKCYTTTLIVLLTSLLITAGFTFQPSYAASAFTLVPGSAPDTTCTTHVALGQIAVFDYHQDTSKAIEVSNMIVQQGGWDIGYWTIGVKGAVNRAFVLTFTRQLTRWTTVGSLSIRRTSNWHVGSITVLYPCNGGVHFYN